jgi:hypothetical protein
VRHLAGGSGLGGAKILISRQPRLPVMQMITDHCQITRCDSQVSPPGRASVWPGWHSADAGADVRSGRDDADGRPAFRRLAQRTDRHGQHLHQSGDRLAVIAHQPAASQTTIVVTSDIVAAVAARAPVRVRAQGRASLTAPGRRSQSPLPPIPRRGDPLMPTYLQRPETLSRARRLFCLRFDGC